MAKADDYRLAIERCTVRAELSPDDEIKQFWLDARDSYKYLLDLEVSNGPSRQSGPLIT